MIDKVPKIIFFIKLVLDHRFFFNQSRIFIFLVNYSQFNALSIISKNIKNYPLFLEL